MLIYTKYSNERSAKFRIRTDILQDKDGKRWIRKVAAGKEAEAHIAGIYECGLLLKKDLPGTGLSVNDCERRSDGVWFPYLEGDTLEVRLDTLLKKKKKAELIREIELYFASFTRTGLKEFHITPEFERVFGSAEFDRKQYSRSVSDIDMIFSNVIEQGERKELIDYEWTFDFPVPVKYLMYRCLRYYILGNGVRRELNITELYRRFDISETEQKQFEEMEKKFQQYMLGDYTPIWKLYDAISDGVIDAALLVEQESRKRHQHQRVTEVFFDDGKGFGSWNCRSYELGPGEKIMLQFAVPEGTRAVRIDPCTGKCIVRMEELTLGGKKVVYESNGMKADNGDLIFDTEDPQIVFDVKESGMVNLCFFVESFSGISRELVLNQHGKIRWMEQTKVWRLYQKVKCLTGRRQQ